MANQIEGVSDSLISCAKQEFLKNGYNDASLREIAQNANTSTSSIYVRFKDKAGLFNAVVRPAEERVSNFFKDIIAKMNGSKTTMQYDQMIDYSQKNLLKLIDIFYDDYDCYKLLVCCSTGTDFEDWIDKLAVLESEQTIFYFNELNFSSFGKDKLNVNLLHMLSSAYWSGIFEVVKHDMNKTDAIKYVLKIQRFFSCGWEDIMSK